MGNVVSAPTLLAAHHDVSNFVSGEPELDDWLTRRALKNQASGASRVYVVCEEDAEEDAEENIVVGYYALAVGSILSSAAPGRVRRNMPNPIPVMVLGRLAVDRQWQGRGLGKDLLRDAIRRTLQAAEIAGIRALLVHALHERAANFYQSHVDFLPSPANERTLMLLLKDARPFVEAD